jgi:hypothetical protein
MRILLQCNADLFFAEDLCSLMPTNVWLGGTSPHSPRPVVGAVVEHLGAFQTNILDARDLSRWSRTGIYSQIYRNPGCPPSVQIGSLADSFGDYRRNKAKEEAGYDADDDDDDADSVELGDEQDEEEREESMLRRLSQSQQSQSSESQAPDEEHEEVEESEDLGGPASSASTAAGGVVPDHGPGASSDLAATLAYLAANSNIDHAWFAALPPDIQQEQVAAWQRQRQQQQSVSPSPLRSLAAASHGRGADGGGGGSSRPRVGEGTLGAGMGLGGQGKAGSGRPSARSRGRGRQASVTSFFYRS